MLLLRLSCFVVSSLPWAFLSPLRRLSSMTTAVRFRLPITLFSMNTRSTLRLIVTSSVSTSSLALSCFLLSFRLYNLLTSSPRLTPLLVFGFFLTNSPCFLLKHLKFERGCENIIVYRHACVYIRDDCVYIYINIRHDCVYVRHGSVFPFWFVC